MSERFSPLTPITAAVYGHRTRGPQGQKRVVSDQLSVRSYLQGKLGYDAFYLLLDQLATVTR
jgi:hypothetical protein